jgi:protein ImuB
VCRSADRRRYCRSIAVNSARNPKVQLEVQAPGAIIKLILEPIEAIGAGHIQYGLWGSDGQHDQRAGWSFARVQGLLGPESVLAPVRSGGRSAIDRITLVPWGDEKVSIRNPADPWPGSIPAPSPTRVPTGTGTETDPVPGTVTVLDDAGQPVLLNGRGLLTGSPAWLGQDGKRADQQLQRVEAWAGPWVLDERWWSADRRSAGARIQVVTETGTAILMRLAADDWQVEGVYD